MRKLYFISLAILAILSCNKEQEVVPAQQVTISATLSESLTKVSFTPGTSGGAPILSLAWEEGDKIRVYNHSNHAQYQDFTLDPACAGKKTGTFTGEAISADAYDIEVVNPILTLATQTQPADGETGDLKYIASVQNVAGYDSITFTDVCGVLLLRAKLPSSEIASAISSVDIISSEAIFYDNGANQGKTLRVSLTTPGDAGGDSILGFYATLSVGDKEIPGGTTLLISLNAPGTGHTVYTRYIKLGSGMSLKQGKLNQIDINASNAAQWAGASDNGTSAAPYLIADKYQMQAMHSLVEAGAKKYFRLVNDVDLDGESWTPLNSGGTEYVNLDGNGHTVSNFTVTGTTAPTGLFGKLNGQVYDLTISNAVATSTNGALGILAGNLGDGGTEDVEVDNVTISDCTVGDSDAYLRVSGILAGNINKAGTIVKNVTVTGSSITGPKSGVSNNMYVGGLVGYAKVECNILSCRVNNCTITGRDIVGGLVGGLGNNNAATCTNCFVDGTTVIDAGFRRVGGLVGMVNAGTVSRCGVESGVAITSSSYDVAGIIGMASNAFTLENSYSNASVSGSNHVGGLIGRLYGAGSVSNCYAAGHLSCTDVKIGGLVGSVEAAGTVSKCISWNSDLEYYGANTGSGTFSDCYIKAASETGTISSHAQEAPRNWSSVIWDFSSDYPVLTDNDLPDGPAEAPAFNIIPYPASVVEGSGSFAVQSAHVYCSTALSGAGDDVVSGFAGRLGVDVEETSASGEAQGFNFLEDNSLGEEAYTITVTSAKVVVKASTRTGLFYAVQTLKQLLPADVYGTSAVTSEWTIPAVTIEDSPRFAHRGFILDVCRHFFKVNEVKKYLDLMAMHKMNRIHLVLTNDQGWRIPIPGYDNLITIGAYREDTPAYPGSSRDNGFYTREQLEDIVQYAADRCITVIPEFDIPGHTIAALASYPDLGCTGGPYELLKTAGTSSDVLCIGKGNANGFQFVKDVLDEMMDIFPSEYIHIGGDEVPSSVAWKSCSHCLGLICDLGIGTEYTKDEMVAMGYSSIAVTKATRLQYYFMKQIRSYLASKGRKMIGWQEMINDEYDLDTADGWQFPGGCIESWTSTARGKFAANKGIDVIMSPSWGCYFSIMQTATPGEPGDGPVNGGDTSNGNRGSDPSKWRPVTLSAAYNWNPHDGVSGGNLSHVKGVECAMWTEYISTVEQLEYMLLPRLAATSEVCWTPQADKSFTRFTGTLEAKQFDIYDILGYNYRRAYE